MFNRPIQPQKPPVQKTSKCKIKIKKKEDGSITKEISGDCSNSQLKALSEAEGES